MSQLFKVAENILSHILHLNFSLILCFIKSRGSSGSAILVADRIRTPRPPPPSDLYAPRWLSSSLTVSLETVVIIHQAP